ncbi:MAG: hypothetical protein JJ892_07035 [Balneola sp.]|nr:hypothetical protein [Balneola sp.]MBO6650885.1 hypothetical protein [Balneola sp.]MBO6711826.1 hypothetical protein [Balneola sp.]MBO6800021.1 hypothetical protein [Balneola sp.]
MRQVFQISVMVAIIFALHGCGLFNSNEKDQLREDLAFFWQRERTLPVSVFRGFDLTENETLYIYGDEHWYQSDDRGLNFKEFQNPDSVYFTKIIKKRTTYYGLGLHSYYLSQYDIDTLERDYFGLTSSIFVSTDGNNWEQKMPAFLMWDFNFQEDSLLHMGKENGIKSFNLETENFRDREFYSSKLSDYANEIFISNDGSIYLGCHDGIYKSVDKGKNWVRSSRNYIHKDDDNVESFYETEEGQLYSIGKKVHLSSDAGSSWDLYTIGFSDEDDDFEDLFGSDMHFRKDGLIYIASYFGIFVADQKNPENAKVAFRYTEDLWHGERYDYVVSFSNGDILLINDTLRRMMRGSKLNSGFWSEFGD